MNTKRRILFICMYAMIPVIVAAFGVLYLAQEKEPRTVDVNEYFKNGFPMNQPRLLSPVAWLHSSNALFRAQALFALGRTEEAMAEIVKSKDDFPESSRTKGVFLFAEERFSEAESVFTEMIPLLGGYPSMASWCERIILTCRLGEKLKCNATIDDIRNTEDPENDIDVTKEIILARMSVDPSLKDFPLLSYMLESSKEMKETRYEELTGLNMIMATGFKKQIIKLFAYNENDQNNGFFLRIENLEQIGELLHVMHDYQETGTMDIALLNRAIIWNFRDQSITARDLSRKLTENSSFLAPIWLDVILGRCDVSLLVDLQRFLLDELSNPENTEINYLFAESLLYDNCWFLMGFCEDEQQELIRRTVERRPWLPLEFASCDHDELAPYCQYDAWIMLRMAWYAKHGMLYKK